MDEIRRNESETVRPDPSLVEAKHFTLLPEKSVSSNPLVGYGTLRKQGCWLPFVSQIFLNVFKIQ